MSLHATGQAIQYATAKMEVTLLAEMAAGNKCYIFKACTWVKSGARVTFVVYLLSSCRGH